MSDLMATSQHVLAISVRLSCCSAGWSSRSWSSASGSSPLCFLRYCCTDETENRISWLAAPLGPHEVLRFLEFSSTDLMGFQRARFLLSV